MKAQLITAPIIEPISLEELKLHLALELDFLDRDEELEGMIKSAREQVEDRTRRALLTQTWDYFLDGWPRSNFIKLPFGNLQDVALTQYVKWKDTDGTATTLTVTMDYLWEMNGDLCGRVVLPYGETWPSGTLYPSNPITIRFVCGWTTAALVPFKIKTAIKMLCADAYENKEATLVGSVMQQYAQNPAFERLLSSARLRDEF